MNASAALWNEINYQRLIRYNDKDGFEGEDVWNADTGALEGKYKYVLDASTAQTVRRANSEAWRGFFENKKGYHNELNTSVTEHPEPLGFRGNEDDGRVLKGTSERTQTLSMVSLRYPELSRYDSISGDKRPQVSPILRPGDWQLITGNTCGCQLLS